MCWRHTYFADVKLFRVVFLSKTKKVYILHIAGYNLNFIIWFQRCKGRFIVHFTFQKWFNSLRIYKIYERLKTLTLSALVEALYRCGTHFDKIGQI